MEADNVFETADIDLAAYLIASGYALSGVRDDNPMRVRFCFLGGEELEEAVKQFYSGEAMVNALGYASALEQVRDHVWGARRRKGKGEQPGERDNE